VSLLPDAAQPLGMAEADEAFAMILDGVAEADAIAGFLTAMAERGETAVEIAAAALAMRERMIGIDIDPGRAIDVCGTGGDGQNTLNVSTAVALVVAACDVPVAKHGNRAASSRAGAADTLEALGLDLDRAGATAAATLKDLGIAFFFARNHHPALVRLAPIRQAIGRRTIFNLLGPLCNPAAVRRQLIGIASPDLLPVYAEAVAILGLEKAKIVSGAEGLDEVSIAGPTRIADINRGRITYCEVAPGDFGIRPQPLAGLRGGDAAHNAAALRALLMGEPSAYRQAVLLNASAALQVAGAVADWRDGIEEAEEALDKGLAKALLDCWIAYR